MYLNTSVTFSIFAKDVKQFASNFLSIDISNYEELVKRTGMRIAYQELEKQENIEAIIDSAYDSLKDKRSCGEGEISREWMHRFIDAAGDISTEELQKIWMETKKTILFVTHSVEEAVYLADRVIVLTPGKEIKTVEINLERPRHVHAQQFVDLRHEILDYIREGV